MRDEFGRPIDVCPMCDFTDVRWRGRRPWDFVFTWMRWFAETMLQGFARPKIILYRRSDLQLGIDDSGLREELREADTGLKTPKRFWKCRACKRKGHVF